MSYVLTITPGVALRLKYARLLKGLKQTELAAIAGVSRATQLSYEAAYGETKVTPPTRQLLP